MLVRGKMYTFMNSRIESKRFKPVEIAFQIHLSAAADSILIASFSN